MTTTKEKIIYKTIKVIMAELKKIDAILESNPLSEVIELVNTIKSVEKMDIKDVGAFLGKALQKRKTLLGLAKKQIADSTKMIDRKVKLNSELHDLQIELSCIERKHK